MHSPLPNEDQESISAFNGVCTCLSGKMHFVGPDQLHGFEERLTTDIYPADFGWIPDWINPDERINLWYHNMSSVAQAGVATITNQLAYDDEISNQALRAIYDHARSSDERPLCLVASFIHPHDPYATRQKYWDLYGREEIDLPRVARPDAGHNDPHSLRLEKVIARDAIHIDDDGVRRARRAYYGNISYVDEWLGRLRAALQECGMADDTTIIFTADHGDMLGERGLWYKMSFYEWSSRIPMILCRPNQFAPRRVDEPVSQVDILPTLVDIAVENIGVNKPDPIDPLAGCSLLSLCGGDTASGQNRAIISEYLAEGTGAPMLMIRKGDYKYTHCPGDPEQLFNLHADSDERANLATLEQARQVMVDFRAERDAHWDVDEVRAAVIADQRRRRVMHTALRIGRYQSWDFQPWSDAANDYTCSHMELTDFDVISRYPRPPVFELD